MDMAVKTARYEVIDPQATGADAVVRAFENQVAYCRDNGAEITAAVCQALLELIDTERGGAVMLRVRKWAGAPLADALPLRVAGGLHTLHLTGEEPALAPIYHGQDRGKCSRTSRKPIAQMARWAAADERGRAFEQFHRCDALAG